MDPPLASVLPGWFNGNVDQPFAPVLPGRIKAKWHNSQTLIVDPPLASVLPSDGANGFPLLLVILRLPPCPLKHAAPPWSVRWGRLVCECVCVCVCVCVCCATEIKLEGLTAGNWKGTLCTLRSIHSRERNYAKKKQRLQWKLLPTLIEEIKATLVPSTVNLQPGEKGPVREVQQSTIIRI